MVQVFLLCLLSCTYAFVAYYPYIFIVDVSIKKYVRAADRVLAALNLFNYRDGISKLQLTQLFILAVLVQQPYRVTV